MMKQYVQWLLAVTLWLATGPVQAQALKVIELRFQEQETGIDPYLTRMLISTHHVRVDDGIDAGDYVLFDRRAKVIYNVLHDSRSLLVVQPGGVDVAMPTAVAFTRKSYEVEEAPAIDGRQPQGQSFSANGQLCDQSVLVPGLLPAASAAIIEFRELLGLQSLTTLANTPQELQTPCFLLMNVLVPARHWRYGLPIRQWDENGYVRELMDFQAQREVAADLFAVPEGYTRNVVGGR